MGTESVGYAVADSDYALLRHKSEAMWGVCLFDGAELCNERRGFRTARRRNRRKKMRIQLVRELFAKEIAKVDADFYKRLDESALWNEDRALPHDNVCRPLTDGCPTIHHLIMKLMDSADGVDIRDLYRAIAWLVAHRGHFLNPASVDDDMSKLTDNSGNYGEFIKWFDDNDFEKPWEADPDKFCEILSEDISITAKTSKLSELTCVKNKSTSDKRSDGYDDEQERLSIKTFELLKLLSGGEVKLSKLIDSEEFSNDKDTICLKTPDKTEEILPKLGIFADLIGRAQTLFDCASLGKLLEGHRCISEVKVKQYDAHQRDLRELIYPRSLVKNDSIHDNLVLVHKKENRDKSNDPIPASICENMRPIWEIYLKKGLINKTKFEHLTRTDPFTAEEKQGFINRQLVETSQSAKAVATLLKDRYTDTEIVYVKAGNVSEFRHQYGAIKEKAFPGEKDAPAIVKSRTASDIHHAHDAYLNIVVGNVFNERFTKRYHKGDKYSLNFDTLFNESIEGTWNAPLHLPNVDKALANNHIHLTKYQICKRSDVGPKSKRGLFNQNPDPIGSNRLIPRKKGLDIKKYGGYSNPVVSFYTIAQYVVKKKIKTCFVPITFLASKEFLASDDGAKKCVAKELGMDISSIRMPFGRKVVKLNSILSIDGLEIILTGKYDDNYMLYRLLTTPYYSDDEMSYIKKIEKVVGKVGKDSDYQFDDNDGINPDKNIALFRSVYSKMSGKVFSKIPNSKFKEKRNGDESAFESLDLVSQVLCLSEMVKYLKTNSCENVALDKVFGFNIRVCF